MAVIQADWRDRDLPEWLRSLVAESAWDQRDWQAWEKTWRPLLAAHGVQPADLYPVGDLARPSGISASSSSKGFSTGLID